MGFAKEIDDKKLLSLSTIDLNKLKDNTINMMLKYIDKWEDQIEINIENLYKRKDYMELLNIIFEDLKISDLQTYVDTNLLLYYKRMRNIKYR